MAVEGRIQNRSYDAQDGSKRYITEIIAEKVTFVNAKRDEQPQNEYKDMSIKTEMQQQFEYIDSDLPF